MAGLNDAGSNPDEEMKEKFREILGKKFPDDQAVQLLKICHEEGITEVDDVAKYLEEEHLKKVLKPAQIKKFMEYKNRHRHLDPKSQVRLVNQHDGAAVDELYVSKNTFDASATGAGDIELIHQTDEAEIENVKVRENKIRAAADGGSVTFLTQKDKAKVKKMEAEENEIKTGVEGVNTAQNELQQGHSSSERAAVCAPHTHDEDDKMDLT